MADSPRRASVSRRADGEHRWSLDGHFTTKLSGEQSDGGFALVEAIAETPPADLSVPPPEVLAPVRERYGIHVVGPSVRMRNG